MAYIYKIYNDINEKVYIGQTKHEIHIRFKEHIKAAKSNSRKNVVLYKAMRKYGIENFHIEMIEECSEDKLDEKEIYWISFYDSYNKGYNMTLGGGGGQTLPTAIHRKINGTPIQQYDLDGNFIAEYISSGEAAEQTNTQQDEINRCCVRSRNAYSANNFIWKRKYDDTPIEIWVEANKRKMGRKIVEQYDLNDDLIQTYPSIAEASKAISPTGNHACISNACNGKRKTAYGYKWKFKD